ncbi:MAG TPA: cellulose biosynthesis cyclic di-GMP-binding regulatory protein BcsB, partial [Nevskiaceae bacterium]|nr:cellulose biosynthesis cyclic di-GMP-binding regulatory protein BcsB [Nevskiaceae bacterium]
DSEADAQRSAIDPDSTIDLRRFPHYTAMPNLALFANAGFPFSKYADLAETALVLPDQPSATDLEAALFLLGRMGRVTGVPAQRFTLAHAAEAGRLADFDLLVIDAGSLLEQWKQNLPAVIDKSRRYITPQTPAPSYDREIPDQPRQNPAAWKVDLNSSGPLGALLGFESPIGGKRSVIALTASSADALGSVLDALEDPAGVTQVRGDVAFVRGRDVASFEIEPKYYVGHLPLWLGLRFMLSDHPLLLALLGILAGLLLALTVHWQLKRIAARRLSP